MISILYHFDKELFYWINGDLSNPLFDLLCPWFRNMYFWFPLYAFIISYLIYSFRKVSAGLLLVIAFSILFSDQISGNLIKNSVKRLRPCNNPIMQEYVITRVTCGSGYSFVSAHSANHFAIALLLIMMLGRRKPWLRWAAPLWAGSVAFSQVYVGVHFPIDIFAGALVGLAVAYFFMSLYKKYINPAFQ